MSERHVSNKAKVMQTQLDYGYKHKKLVFLFGIVFNHKNCQLLMNEGIKCVSKRESVLWARNCVVGGTCELVSWVWRKCEGAILPGNLFGEVSWEQSAASLTFLLVMSFFDSRYVKHVFTKHCKSSEWSLLIMYSPVVATTTHIGQTGSMLAVHARATWCN
jgi:hypothetical protein